jgi:hypothetical protein
MTPTSDRAAAAELAQRVKSARIDPSKEDEADRSPDDKPPGFAQVLMSEGPTSIEEAAALTPADWALIDKVLEHYIRCEGK